MSHKYAVLPYADPETKTSGWQFSVPNLKVKGVYTALDNPNLYSIWLVPFVGDPIFKKRFLLSYPTDQNPYPPTPLWAWVPQKTNQGYDYINLSRPKNDIPCSATELIKVQKETETEIVKLEIGEHVMADVITDDNQVYLLPSLFSEKLSLHTEHLLILYDIVKQLGTLDHTLKYNLYE